MSKMIRRDFLKTLGAAGAVSIGAGAIPFGLGARRALAQTDDRLGKVVVTYTPAARLHTYVAPEEGARVTTHIIETENSLVLVDSQLALPFAQEVLAYTESLGKPIERILLSHDHPDHWSGSVAFDLPLTTTANIAANLQAGLDAGQYQPVEGFQAPETTLVEGSETIDGLTFEFSTVQNAEALEQVIIRIPEAKTVILQDLMYNNTYFFPGLDRPNWISILDTLRQSIVADGIETVLVGHGVPTTRGALDTGIEYLTMMEELFTTAESAEAVVQAIQARYPSYEAAFLLTFYESFFAPR